MLKPYHTREVPQGEQVHTLVTAVICSVSASKLREPKMMMVWVALIMNSSVGGYQIQFFLVKTETHLSYLPSRQRGDVLHLLHSYSSLFGDVLSHTSVCEHDRCWRRSTNQAACLPLPYRETRFDEKRS